MDLVPPSNEPSNRARDPERSWLPRAADSASARRATAYTPKPNFVENPFASEKAASRRWGLWLTIVTAAALGCGGLAFHHRPGALGTSADKRLVLTAGDIDQAATANARALLERGEVPAALAGASGETRREVADGRRSLYSKQLLRPESSKGFIVHVTISEQGSVIGEEVLTSEHPRGTTFPAGPTTPVHFHFAVERTGPAGTITCGATSSTGASVYTAPMPVGGSGDLEAVAR